jgi:hypothetical protein
MVIAFFQTVFFTLRSMASYPDAVATIVEKLFARPSRGLFVRL